MIPVTLEKLDELLGSKKISGALVAVTFLIFFFSLNYILLFILAAAVLFALYMMAVLYKYEKYGWMTAFVILMSATCLLSVFSGNYTIFGIIINYLPLFSFFLFCAVLKVQVRDWVMELDYERDLRRQQAINEFGNR